MAIVIGEREKEREKMAMVNCNSDFEAEGRQRWRAKNRSSRSSFSKCHSFFCPTLFSAFSSKNSFFSFSFLSRPYSVSSCFVLSVFSLLSLLLISDLPLSACSRQISDHGAASDQVQGRKIQGDAGHGFEVVSSGTFLHDWNTTVVHYRHTATQADFLSLSNSDPSKFFAITLKTYPLDDYGAAHVLEHSVLSGSAKYPVNNLIQEISKVSVGHVNAFTAPDHTSYHGSSYNTKDLYNILDVWWDGVFHPAVLTDERIFHREAWSYNLDSESGQYLSREGVVMDEMYWAHSQDNFLIRSALERAVFEGTPYALEAGGNPFLLHNLTHSEVKAFHARYYHPSNCLILMYGDDDPNQRLQHLGGLLSTFTVDQAVRNNGNLPSIPMNGMTRTSSITYYRNVIPYGLYGYVWVLDNSFALDMEKRLELRLLDSILETLLFSPGSGLSQDLVLMSFIDMDSYANPIAVILFHDTANIETTKSTIVNTLRSLTVAKFSNALKELMKSSLLTLRDDYNEFSDDKGEDYFKDVVAFWKRSGNLLSPVNVSASWNAVFHKFETSGASILSHLINDVYVTNPNRVEVTLGEYDLSVLVEQGIQQKLLNDIPLPPENLSAIVNNSHALEFFSRPADAATTAVLPALELSDLKFNFPKPVDKAYQIGLVKVVENYMHTNGLFYIDVLFDVSVLTQEQVLLAAVLSKGWNYLLPAETTGIDSVTFHLNASKWDLNVDMEYLDNGLTGARMGMTNGSGYIRLSGRCPSAEAAMLIDLMRVFTLQIDLDAQSTFASISASGYWLAPWSGYLRTQLTLRLLSKDSVRGWFEDSTNGHGAYLKSREVKKLASTNLLAWRQILHQLKDIHGLVVRAGGARISLIGDTTTIGSVSESVKTFAESLPLPTGQEQSQNWTQLGAAVNESVSVPVLVYSTSRSRNVYKGGWKASGTVYVINEVQTAWINTIIRSQRHAYGGGSDFYPSTGLVAHLSWADPRIRASLRAFDESAQYLTTLTESSENITRIAVAALGKRMEPLTPYEEGFKRFKDYLVNVTPSDYEQLYNELNSTSLLDFQAYGAALAASSGFTVIAVPPFIRDDAAKAEPSLNFTTLETPYTFLYNSP